MTGNTYCMSSSTTAAMRMRAKMSLTNQLPGSRRQMNAYILCTTVLSDLVVCLRILDALRRSVLGGGPVGEFGVGDVALPGREHRVARRTHRLDRSEEHTSELQSRGHLVCRLLLEKKTNI